MLDSCSLDLVKAREGRYDAVFHLVTAADGASQFYTKTNNETRHESIESAITQDRLTQNAWNGHPHHIIVDNHNGKSFEDKMNELASKISSFIGLPSFSRKSHKYILQTEPIIGLIPNLSQFDVEKIFLKERVRTVAPALTMAPALLTMPSLIQEVSSSLSLVVS